MCVVLGVCVKAWNFSIFSYASTWSNITYGHTIDGLTIFASHLNLHQLNQNALLESGYKHHMERGAYMYTKVLSQAKSTKPKP
jgi:hypothetical protein